MKPKCEDCRYWEAYQDQFKGEGSCRRNAPFPKMRDDGYTDKWNSYWPSTYADDWCGEFQPKEDE